MAVYKENDCVGCEVCRGCGRRESYYVAECDVCGATSIDGEHIFEDFTRVGNRDLCPRCLEEV